MKKFTKSIILMLVAFALCFAMAACGDTPDGDGGDDAVATYAVTYSLGGGTGTLPTETDKRAGEKFTLASATGLSNGDKLFDGWSDGTSVYAASAEYTMPAKAVTFTATWKDAEAEISNAALQDLLGSWSGDGTTLKAAEYTDSTNIIAKGVLNGNTVVNFYIEEEVCYVSTSDSRYFGTVTKVGSALAISLQEYDEENAPTGEPQQFEFATKTELANAPISDFAGKWQRSDTKQPWIIKESAVYYGLGASDASAITVGSNLILFYTASGSEYYNVLNKDGDTLSGYYLAPQKDPVQVAFEAGAFYTVSVNGVLKQIVTSGKQPSSITPDPAPEGQRFSKWVLVGTETEFSFDEVLTADVDIEAVYEEVQAGALKTFTGTVKVESKSFTQAVINVETGEVTLTKSDGETVDITTSIEAEGFKATNASSVFDISTVWLVINGDTLEFYDDWGGPDEYYGSLTLAE